METSIAICIGLALSSIILSGISITLACIAWSVVIGLKNSTHQIQYVPLTNEEGDPLEGEHLDNNMKEALSQEHIERDYV